MTSQDARVVHFGIGHFRILILRITGLASELGETARQVQRVKTAREGWIGGKVGDVVLRVGQAQSDGGLARLGGRQADAELQHGGRRDGPGKTGHKLFVTDVHVPVGVPT